MTRAPGKGPAGGAPTEALQSEPPTRTVGPVTDTLRPLDFHLIHESPYPIYQGEIPLDHGEIPAPVVVNLCGMHPQGNPYDKIVMGLALLDSVELDHLVARRRLERFLESVHIHAGTAPTYWHCHAGINRASFALSAYLHLYRGMRISQAIALIRERRYAMCLCNALFEEVLRTWYGEPDEQDFEPVDIKTWLEQRTGKVDPDQWRG